MNELALFAGAGGGILGGKLLGWQTVCAVECDPYAASVLAARQNDGSLEPFPIWDDVRTFDGGPWRGIVDVISGGFPCQDISFAGKGEGIDGERSGLWSEMARVVGEVRPRYVFVENSPAIIRRGLTRVVSDLATLGYDSRWRCLSAVELGAPHRRNRFWLLATDTNREPLRDDKQRDTGGRNHLQDSRDAKPPHDGSQEHLANHHGQGQLQQSRTPQESLRWSGYGSEQSRRRVWWAAEPSVGRVADGVAHRMDRLKCLGNGQVPAVAARAWTLLAEMEAGESVN